MTRDFGIAVAERYDLGAVKAVARAHRGAMGQMWRLRTTLGEFAVKEFFWGAEEAAVAREVDFCRRAVDAGVRAPACVPAANGSFTARVGGAAVRVYEWVDGEAINQPTMEIAQWAGRTLAIIHSLKYPANRHIVDPWYTAIPAIEEFVALAGRARSMNISWGDALHDALPRIDGLVRSLPEEGPTSAPIYCHHDMQPQNILLTRQGPYLVDWDDAGPAYPDRELLTMLYCWGPQSGDPRLAREVANAYRRSGVDRLPIDYGAFRELVADTTNYVKAQAELALHADTAEDMRGYANNAVVRTVAGLPTPERLNNLLDVIQS